MNDFSSEKFEIKIIQHEDQILINFSKKWNMKIAANLILNKGSLAFYETFSKKSLVGLFNDETQLISLLRIDTLNDSGAEIACMDASEFQKTNEYLRMLEQNQKCKFAWQQDSENSSCLYALKTDDKKGSLIIGHDIESVKFKHIEASKINEIEIKLNESAVDLWAEATKRNMDKAIAIVLDNQVISAPIVRSVITGGNCSITGNYTETEAKYIAALGNNGELPLSFRIVK